MLSTDVVGIPLHIVLLIRSIRTYRRTRVRSTRPVLDFSTGVHITHETSVKVDEAGETSTRGSSIDMGDHIDFALLVRQNPTSRR